MSIDFSDLIHEKSSAISFDDLIPKKGTTVGEGAAPTWTDGKVEFAPEANVPSDKSGQSLPEASVNALGQGLVGGVGSAVAGTGRVVDAGVASPHMLEAYDLVDQGKNRDAYQKLTDTERQMVGAYRGASPEGRAAMRSGNPNSLVTTGEAIADFGQQSMPVSPEQEGHTTGALRMVGGILPAALAGALGGPTGALAVASTIGAQSYEGTYKDAIAKGATPEEADTAAGKSAVAQSIAMGLPVGKVLQTVPVPLRDGLMATLFNLGKHGVEMGAGNTLGTIAQNYVASQTYDPGRPLLHSTGDAAIDGAIAGLIIRGGAIGANAARSEPRPNVADIGKAEDIDTAIATADKVISAPVEVTPQPASRYGEAPAFVPPSTEPLLLPRIRELINEDNRIAANKPDFIPTTTQASSSENVPIPGATVPVRQPTIPSMWSEVFSSKADTPEPLTESVGAAASRQGTPTDQSIMSTSDMKANRRVAEQSELLMPPEPNDRNIYVEGSFPTLAERTGDPVVSQTENFVRQRNPGEFVGEGKILTENNKARVAGFNAETVPDTTLNTMRRDRQAKWIANSEEILPNAKPVDLAETSNWIEDQLNNPRIQEVDAVRSVLEDIHQRLYSGEELKSDPAAIWGIHDHLQNMLAKAKDPLNMTGAEKFAEMQILEAKRLVDKAMNVATEGRFAKAMADYAEASKEINAGVLMNEFWPKLTNMQGEIQANNFHRWALGLAKERGDPGIDPTMDISDKTMQKIIAIHKDLKRAGLIKLGGAAGSPTNLLGALGESLGIHAAHSVLGAIPGVGPILRAGSEIMGRMKLDALTKKHLAPPEGGYIYPSQD